VEKVFDQHVEILLVEIYRSRRCNAEAQPEWGRRGHGPPEKKLVKICRWCFISISTV